MLAFLYLSLSLLITVLWVFFTFRATKELKYTAWVLIGLLLWQGYVLAWGFSGFLQNFELPPRFPLIIVFPAFLFMGIFLSRNKKKNWVQQIPLHWMVYFQSFRIIIEVLFIFSIGAGILPKDVTIEGYNFDIFIGISALFVGFSFQKKWISETFLLYWNYLGILVLASVVFVFVSTVYFPQIYGFEKTPMPLAFASSPYVLIAGYLMPSAVFMHFLSLVRLRNKLE